MSNSMHSERMALVKAGRAERASSSPRAKILAISAGVAVGAAVTTTSTAAAATATATATASATATGSIPVSAAVTGASFAGWKMVVVAAGLLAATGVAAVAVAVNERSVTPPRVESSRMVSPPGPTSTTTTIANPASASEVPTMSVGDLPTAKEEARQAPRPVATNATPANEPTPAAAPASLADEMKSAEAIRSASREGRIADAIRLLDEHDARFPNGALSEETLVLRIEAFAKAGRNAEAKTLAEKFLSERPKSPYAPRVRSTISRLD